MSLLTDPYDIDNPLNGQVDEITLAEQALNHPNIDSDNVWGDVFYSFPLHPYSTGVKYSGGIWEVDGAYACVFADNSMLLWDDSLQSFKVKTWDMDEALENFDEQEAEEIRQQVSELMPTVA